MRLARTNTHYWYDHEPKDGVERIEGVRGLLTIGPCAWPTIERGSLGVGVLFEIQVDGPPIAVDVVLTGGVRVPL